MKSGWRASWHTAATLAAGVVSFGLLGTGHATTSLYSGWNDGQIITSGQNIVVLRVSPGSYLIHGNVNLDQDDVKVVTVTCKLLTGEDHDDQTLRLAANGGQNLDQGVFSMQVVRQFASAGLIRLTCSFPASQSTKMRSKFSKITAIRIDGTFCNQHTPADCRD